MTTLRRTIRRSLPRAIERCEWTVEMDAVGLVFRMKHGKRRYPLSWNTVWYRAMELEAERIRQERTQRRKERGR